MVYILDQVRALEREMTQRLEDAGIEVRGWLGEWRGRGAGYGRLDSGIETCLLQVCND